MAFVFINTTLYHYYSAINYLNVLYINELTSHREGRRSGSTADSLLPWMTPGGGVNYQRCFRLSDVSSEQPIDLFPLAGASRSHVSGRAESKQRTYLR